jgi:hypothetical protein
MVSDFTEAMFETDRVLAEAFAEDMGPIQQLTGNSAEEEQLQAPQGLAGDTSQNLFE